MNHLHLPPSLETANKYLQTAIAELADDGLNAAALLIQQRLGVCAGDYAALFFSDDKVQHLLQEYIAKELTYMLDCQRQQENPKPVKNYAPDQGTF